ncbi:hypothetical protein ACFVWG_08085 [Kribbella sp. NPDC058245]|uniref:hypothetical protein n=1 Tax=Kribbella sp. NPDC058245 TaxID=3346399 RepID=UPI0036ED283B
MSHGPINFGGIGDIDMYPDQTGALMRRLEAAGVAFGSQLPTLLQTINRGEQEANTGFDTLSKNFRLNYNASANQLKTLTGNVQPMLVRIATEGIRVVAEYVQHAENEAATMRRV